MKVLERDIQATILDYLNYLPGVRCYRRNIGSRPWQDGRGRKRVVLFGVRGQSDIWGYGPGGIHIEIEVKRPGEEPTTAQHDWINECRQAGCIAFWTDSLDDCIEKLRDEYRLRGWKI